MVESDDGTEIVCAFVCLFGVCVLWLRMLFSLKKAAAAAAVSQASTRVSLSESACGHLHLYHILSSSPAIGHIAISPVCS